MLNKQNFMNSMLMKINIIIMRKKKKASAVLMQRR